MTDTATTGRQLPYGQTVAELRQMIAQHAQQAEETFGQLWDANQLANQRDSGPIPEDRRRATFAAHHGALYGWALVAILRWLAEEHGPELAYRAAAIVQELGMNGGNELLDDIPPGGGDDELSPGEIVAGGQWLIWSHEHDAWWAPNSSGYRTNVAEAGRYNRADAERACSLRTWYAGDRPPEVMVPAPPDHLYGSPQLAEEMQARIHSATTAAIARRDLAGGDIGAGL